MAKKSKTGLPKKVYVYIDDDDPQDTFLSAFHTVDRTAEPGRSRLVGVYELKETVLVELETVVFHL